MDHSIIHAGALAVDDLPDSAGDVHVDIFHHDYLEHAKSVYVEVVAVGAVVL